MKNHQKMEVENFDDFEVFVSYGEIAATFMQLARLH